MRKFSEVIEKEISGFNMFRFQQSGEKIMEDLIYTTNKKQ
jgi:hypothetical protein